jgi:Na+/proline symporter
VQAGRDGRGEGGRMTRTRRIIFIIILAFVIYSVYTNPNLSASYVRTAFLFIASTVQSIFAFFGALLK